MPAIEYAKQTPASVTAETVIVFAAKDGDDVRLGQDAAALGEVLELDLGAQLKALRFDGSLGSIARVPARGKAKCDVVLVAGLGEVSDADLESLRRAAGCAVRNAQKDASAAVVVPADLLADGEGAARARAAAEGAGLGAYAFTAYRTKTHDLPSLERLLVVSGHNLDSGEVRAGAEQAQAVVRATCLTRDLVNTPPQDKRPPALADRVSEIAKEAGLKTKVLDEQALQKGGFGGLIGVGRGSSMPPRLVELTYEPSRAKGHVVLVGKGITFDSGGLSLKPSEAMQTMKCDMSGAAAVVGAMVAAAALGLRVQVTGLIALAENMPSGTATRVGDVLTHYDGTTVEVLNTDAEGRLVLADALAYGAERDPDALIDIATLTGAQVVALGNQISAVMGTDDDLVEALLSAAREAGEGLWKLPLASEYREHLDSQVADLKNIGKAREAGTIVAGLFLKEFTAGMSWAHLDIAGPSFTEEGDAFYTPKGATGASVRTLVRYLEARS